MLKYTVEQSQGNFYITSLEAGPLTKKKLDMILEILLDSKSDSERSMENEVMTCRELIRYLMHSPETQIIVNEEILPDGTSLSTLRTKKGLINKVKVSDKLWKIAGL